MNQNHKPFFISKMFVPAFCHLLVCRW